jgi:hypothetical protein
MIPDKPRLLQTDFVTLLSPLEDVVLTSLLRCDRTFLDKFCSAFISDHDRRWSLSKRWFQRISAGSLAAAHCVFAGCLAATNCGLWICWVPAVSGASNKAMFLRVELDTLSFRPESPSLDSRTPLLTPNVTSCTRMKFDGQRRLDQDAKVPGMCSGH